MQVLKKAAVTSPIYQPVKSASLGLLKPPTVLEDNCCEFILFCKFIQWIGEVIRNTFFGSQNWEI